MTRQRLTLRLSATALICIAMYFAIMFIRRETSPGVAAIRELVHPILVSEAPYFYEGGSIGLTLVGTQGNQLKCGINQQKFVGSVNPLVGRICLFEHHTSNEGAMILERASFAERLLIETIRNATATEEHSDLRRQFLSRFDAATSRKNGNEQRR